VAVIKNCDVSSQDETRLLFRFTEFIVMSVDSQLRVAFITHDGHEFHEDELRLESVK
jgi:hypothetical protein